MVESMGLCHLSGHGSTPDAPRSWTLTRTSLLRPLAPPPLLTQARAAAWTFLPSPSARPAAKRSGTRRPLSSSLRRCSFARRAGASQYCTSRWTGTRPTTCGAMLMPVPIPLAPARAMAERKYDDASACFSGAQGLLEAPGHHAPVHGPYPVQREVLRRR